MAQSMCARGNLPIQMTSRVPSLIIVCSVGHWFSDSAPLGVKAYCSKPTAEKTSANLDTGIASPLVLDQLSVACNSNIFRSQCATHRSRVTTSFGFASMKVLMGLR